MPDEPFHGGAFGLVQPQPGRHAPGDPGAQDRVVLVPALADVVQQERDVEDPAVHALLQDRGRHGQGFDEVAVLDLGQVPDALDGMLVDGVVVIHVELHHRHDRFELGDKRRQHAQLVHPAQRAVGIAVFQQQVEEDAPGLFRIAHLVVDQVQVRLDEAHRVGMDQEPGAQRLFIEAQDVHLVRQERILVGNRETAREHLVAGPDLGRALEDAHQKGRVLLLLGLEGGQHDARQVAHRDGVTEIGLHEDLDPAPAAAIGKAHPRRHLDLHVEAQRFRRAPGDQVQVAAHRPEKILGLHEGVVFLGAEHAHADKRLGILGAVHVFQDPVERLQIAQAAFALFDIGFHHVALAALFFVAAFALGELGIDEFGLGAVEQLIAQPRLEIGGEIGIAGHVAAFKHRGADGEILAAQADAILDGARGVADFQLQIPQDVEHRFDDALGPAGDFVGIEKQQIDIREGRHLAAPVAAHGEDRQALCLGPVGHRVQPVGRDLEDQRDHAVGDVGVAAGDRLGAKRLCGEGGGDRVAACVARRAQDAHRGLAHGALVGRPGDLGVQLGADRLPVEQLLGRQDQVGFLRGGCPRLRNLRHQRTGVRDRGW